MKRIRTRVASISANEVAQAAVHGVERAQAARKAAGEELSPEEVPHVSGAMVLNNAAAKSDLNKWVTYGWYRDVGPKTVDQGK